MSTARTYKVVGLLFSLILASVFLAACVGRPPLRSYTIARTAVESAKKADASRVAPDDMHSAEENYRRGEFYYKKQDYASAVAAFEDAIEFAEQAENKARLSKK